MSNYFPIRLLWLSLSLLTRLVVVVTAIMAMMFALAIIALRYYLLPDIELYHDKITTSLSRAIGNTVTVGRIEGDWLGLQPRLKLTDVRILDDQQQPALVLPGVNGCVSWMSLFTAELRLVSLEVFRPELLIRRDVDGEFFLGDLALDKHGEENDMSDWLLHQSKMVVHDAFIVWLDERRAAPPLILQKVNLRIENFFNRHRFALRALPPENLATPLDVRGNFMGDSFDNFGTWRGQIFTQLDYTDVIAWRPWLDLPDEFSNGRGALRGWFGFEKGTLVRITTDLELRDVVTKLAEDVPAMKVLELRGRAGWQNISDDFEISASKLGVRLTNGIVLPPTDFYFRNQTAGDGHPVGGEIRANELQLEVLAALVKYLPLQAEFKAKLEAYAPSGKVSNLAAEWQGQIEKPKGYKIKGNFDNLGLHQVGKMPGFSGLTLDVVGNEARGRLNIISRQLKVDAPGIMREPLLFDTLTGQGGWQHKAGELLIKVDNVAVSNKDLAGNLYGSYQTLAGTRGVLDLTAKLTRGDIRRAARYTPLVALHQAGNDWLNGALLAGHTEDFRIRIKGNLSDFPLDGTKDARFNIGGHAQDAVLEFDKKWPRIENITGEFMIRGNRLEVKSPSANILGAHLRDVNVTIPNMMSADLPLVIRGEADAPSDEFLKFVQQSPVRGYIDGFTDGISASGNSQLALYARIPLLGAKKVEVSGNIRMRDNDIDLAKGIPRLRNTSGVLSFTESGMQVNNVSAQILGGPASINMKTIEGGAVHTTLKGHFDLDVLRSMSTSPLLDYLSGGADWDADITVAKKSAQMLVQSDLKGVSSSLPQPFTKPVDEVMNLRLEENSDGNDQDTIAVHLGNLLNAQLIRHKEKGEMVIKYGSINLGDTDKVQRTRLKQPVTKSKKGVRLTGSLPVFSIQGWEGLTGSSNQAVPALPINYVNLDVDRLIGYGLDVDSLSIEAVEQGEGMVARLSSANSMGKIEWQPHGYENVAKLSVRLSSVQLGKTQGQDSQQSKGLVRRVSQKKVGKLRPGSFPAFEFAIEDLKVKDQHIGRIELVGHPDGDDWRMRRLRITNPDGSLMGDGVWSVAPVVGGSDVIPDFVSTASGGIGSDGTHCQVNLQLQISDAGKILERSGYPGTVNKGSGKLISELKWSGAPNKFNNTSLNGTLNLDTGKGRFLKMNPGAGKLLSVLSLQDLPKHVALGFTDVFSEGFEFDNINGNAAIRNGVVNTDDFKIYGSSAKATIKGYVDLNKETQDLKVKILPTLGSSVSLIGAFAISPVVGIGSLIVNKVLGDPLDKLVSFEYNVSGTWSEPSVIKVGSKQPQQEASKLGK